MEQDLLYFFKNINFDFLVLSLIVFSLTMIIKWPIKKATSKLKDNKRKALNSIIVFIPVILSFISCTLFFGLTTDVWFNVEIVESTLSVWLIALTIYSIYSRLALVIKGVFSGKVKVNQQLASDILTYLKNNIKDLNKDLKNNEKKLKAINKKTNEIITLKNVMENSEESYDLAYITKINQDLNVLNTQESLVSNNINNIKNQITSFKNKLYINKEDIRDGV